MREVYTGAPRKAGIAVSSAVCPAYGIVDLRTDAGLLRLALRNRRAGCGDALHWDEATDLSRGTLTPLTRVRAIGAVFEQLAGLPGLTGEFAARRGACLFTVGFGLEVVVVSLAAAVDKALTASALVVEVPTRDDGVARTRKSRLPTLRPPARRRGRTARCLALTPRAKVVSVAGTAAIDESLATSGVRIKGKTRDCRPARTGLNRQQTDQR